MVKITLDKINTYLHSYWLLFKELLDGLFFAHVGEAHPATVINLAASLKSLKQTSVLLQPYF